jgi:hypothetical protein
MRLWRAISIVIVLSLMVSSASAATLFFDDFERGTFAGTNELDAVTDDGPLTSGAWTVSGVDPDYGFKGEWHPASGNIPDSYVFGGHKVGMTIRSAKAIKGAGYCDMDATFAEQNSAAEAVRFEADFYGQTPGSTTVDLKLAMLSGATELNSVVLSGGASGGSVVANGVNTVLTYSTGAWHHVTMDYTPGQSTFTLAVDSQTAVTGLAATPSAVDGFRFVQTSTGQDRWSVFDNVSVTSSAVPEPSSVVLLFGLGIGFVAYAWRKRR